MRERNCNISSHKKLVNNRKYHIQNNKKLMYLNVDMCLIVYYVGDGDKAHKEYGEVQFCHCIYCG